MKRALMAVWRWRFRFAYLVLALTFLGLVARFHVPGSGFTSLLSIGAKSDERAVPRLRAVPHYAIEDSWGYDGTYYVQLALHPWLDEPEQLKQSIDNPSYRARRILPSWVAWTLGLGRAEWIVQIFALLNVGVWLALAWVLLRWLPPDNAGNLLRWAGILFSHGMCMSVRNSLADAPGLLLVALMVVALERGRKPRAMVALGAALLTKETSLLAGTALIPPRGSGWRAWAVAASWGALAILPFAAWLGFVRWHLGANHDAGLGNFTLPLAGLVEKGTTVVTELFAGNIEPQFVGNVLVLVALVTQATFFLLHREPGKMWWRIGASFAVMMLFIAQPVWEGYPGAATRVLLPMMLAFNVLVPRGRRWLAVLALGNLSAIVGVNEFNAPPHESFVVSGERAVRTQIKWERGAGWYGAEGDGRRQWRWSSGPGRLRLTNTSKESVTVRLSGEVAALKPMRVTIRAGDAVLWHGAVAIKREAFETALFSIPANAAQEIEFRSDVAGVQHANGDERVLAFAVYDVDIAVARAGPVAKSEGSK
jgi:hypothetical protein